MCETCRILIEFYFFFFVFVFLCRPMNYSLFKTNQLLFLKLIGSLIGLQLRYRVICYLKAYIYGPNIIQYRKACVVYIHICILDFLTSNPCFDLNKLWCQLSRRLRRLLALSFVTPATCNCPMFVVILFEYQRFDLTSSLHQERVYVVTHSQGCELVKG